MKQHHILALLQNGYTTIQVQFELGGRLYTYKARGTIAVGDIVVVDTPSRGLSTAQVVVVHPSPRIDIDSNIQYKWIVQVVDRTEYDRVAAQEQQFLDTMIEIEKVRQRDALMQSFKEHLPEGSAARAMFDAAVGQLGIAEK